MPGHILQCQKCGKSVRVGYSLHAVNFAAAQRGVPVAEIIEDYYTFNHSLREDPKVCPACGAPGAQMKEIEPLS